jgi:hypothetical protein
MPMTQYGILWSALLILALTVSPQAVRADDECILDEFQAVVKQELAAAARAEKSGKPADIFVAYQAVLEDGCVRDKNIQAKYRAALPKLARDVAKAAEAKGLLYSKEPIYAVARGQGQRGNVPEEGGEVVYAPRHANERASAFAWLEASGDYNEANRVMLKVAHAKSDDLKVFQTAWDVDQHRPTSQDPKTGETKPYVSPQAYRQELQKIASVNADRFMKAEEKDAAGLTGSANDVGMATMNSMDKLRKASEWMKFLTGGDKPARERAEQRGDTILKRSDPTVTRMNATAYYEFAGTPKAKEKLAQLEKKSEESAKAMEKSARKMEGVITEKSAADQKKFDKGKANLEKELGF